MATKKGAGTAKNLTDSNPQYLGIKLYGGETASIGAIIVRQRGSKILPGRNVNMGSDHTLYAAKAGVVKFGTKRITHFDSKVKSKKIVHIEPKADAVSKDKRSKKK